MTLIESKPISVGIRLATMIMDHFFMTFVALIFASPYVISKISDTMTMSHEQPTSNIFDGPMGYIFLFGFTLYFCKDMINGRSIAKRILKLQVVDNKTGQVATPFQCLVRNIFGIIWPIEVIIAMLNTGRRLGDRVAGTRLVYYDKTARQPGLQIGKIILPALVFYGIMVLLIQLSGVRKVTVANYRATSYNAVRSKEMQQLIVDSLGQYLIPDIRIYDSTRKGDLKYLSAIFKLKENYIDDEGGYAQLHEMITRLIYSKLPEQSFKGQLQYFYKGPGQFQSRTMMIGTVN